jgi:hypothetical protein
MASASQFGVGLSIFSVKPFAPFRSGVLGEALSGLQKVLKVLTE